jgi:hypothetical protein
VLWHTQPTGPTSQNLMFESTSCISLHRQRPGASCAGFCVCACLRACLRACARARTCARARVHVCERQTPLSSRSRSSSSGGGLLGRSRDFQNIFFIALVFLKRSCFSATSTPQAEGPRPLNRRHSLCLPSSLRAPGSCFSLTACLGACRFGQLPRRGQGRRRGGDRERAR